ncbi:MAG TPA: DUF488 domain-containing protein [Actinomycetota bacterium]|nr:DUF488 domain-containing protein [Actinomycetota bacterium]
MRLFTIGFTKKSAETFFETLLEAGVKRVVDIRLYNRSQLAGFARRDHLAYLLDRIGGIDYIHEPRLSPTPELFTALKKQKCPWQEYEEGFLQLMRDRQVEEVLRSELRDDDCLLCTEDKADHCHRRLVAEYLREAWGEVQVHHLG